MGKVLLAMSLVLTIAPSLSARGWRGIIPLHSTRADVERLLGKPSSEVDNLYKTENDLVRVDYAKGPCNGWPRGWNVASDTVLALTVMPSAKQMFSDLHVAIATFSKTYDDAFFTYYASRAQGVEYIVSSEGFLSSTKYFPARGDAVLRCKCFPSEDDSVFRGETWDSFEGISMENILARLDNFAIQLSNSRPDWKGRVITYSPLRAGRSGASAFRNRLYEWLTVKRGIDPRRVTVIAGGHRQKYSGEFYLLSPGVTAPPPLATIGSCDQKHVQ
jgi:hypothetical protein